MARRAAKAKEMERRASKEGPVKSLQFKVNKQNDLWSRASTQLKMEKRKQAAQEATMHMFMDLASEDGASGFHIPSTDTPHQRTRRASMSEGAWNQRMHRAPTSEDGQSTQVATLAQ